MRRVEVSEEDEAGDRRMAGWFDEDKADVFEERPSLVTVAVGFRTSGVPTRAEATCSFLPTRRAPG